MKDIKNLLKKKLATHFLTMKPFRHIRIKVGYRDEHEYISFIRSVVSAEIKKKEFNQLCFFGSGEHTSLVFRADPQIRELTSYICDNNPSLWGTTKFGIDIISPEKAVKICDAIFLSTAVSQDAMRKQLKKINFNGTIFSPDDNVPTEWFKDLF